MKNKPDIISYIKKAYRHFTVGMAVLILTVCAIAVTGCSGGSGLGAAGNDVELLPPSWPSAFDVEPNNEPPFVDDPARTNNAFNVQDFGEQGTNGWFYRYGNSKRPE